MRFLADHLPTAFLPTDGERTVWPGNFRGHLRRVDGAADRRRAAGGDAANVDRPAKLVENYMRQNWPRVARVRASRLGGVSGLVVGGRDLVAGAALLRHTRRGLLVNKPWRAVGLEVGPNNVILQSHIIT